MPAARATTRRMALLGAVTAVLFAAPHAWSQETSGGPRWWPQFRGPGGTGVAREGEKLPVEFGSTRNVVWKTPLPPGHSSPCVWQDRIFLTGFDGEGQKLETVCLDRGDGRLLWRRAAPAEQVEKVHPVNSPAASTPATDGQRVYVYFGSYGLLCYDQDGRLASDENPKDLVIFSRGGPGGVGDITLGHLFGMADVNKDQEISRLEWGLALVFSSHFKDALVAIRPGGHDNVTRSHVAWRADRGLPEVPSPLYYRGHLYVVKNGGIVSCFGGQTGQLVYRRRLGEAGQYYASPVAGDGKVYVASEPGVVTVFEAGETGRVLATNDLGERIMATPALVESRIYLRTTGHLWAFGE